MHAVLVTFVLLTAAHQPAAVADQQPNAAAVADSGGSCDSCQGEACGDACRTGCLSGLRSSLWDWFGPMPQTCYAPRFGCYPGNDRHMHRYPAFHGYYYRQPYNYRHAFDYPWHAQPHEPVGYFTYQKDPSVDESLTPVPAEGTPPAAVEPKSVPSPPPTPGVSQSGRKRTTTASRTLHN